MEKRNSFKGSIGFVLAAAGSAVGLGNIWRFPYLAAKDGGGLFLVIYFVLAFTFGFTLLTAEVAIGRKTKQSPLTAYSRLKKGWKPLGVVACIVPFIILPYYAAIGGWIVKYFVAFVTGKGTIAAEDNYFIGFITGSDNSSAIAKCLGGEAEPVIYMLIFAVFVFVVVFMGVNKGIESFSKLVMPALVVLCMVISIFALTLKYTDADGTVRTGLEGLKVYVIPNLDGVGIKEFAQVTIDAMSQLFFSLSIAMGIMITYGSYMSDETNMSKSINQIEIFDTAIAFLAGVMIIPAVYVFMGVDDMNVGPGLMFVSLPKVFSSMGGVGTAVGCLFFAMAFFAALTSAVSILEAVVSSLMDQFSVSRKTAVITEGIIALVLAVIVCLGYNVLMFDVKLPNGSSGQILDVMDYISNNVLMPIVAIATCVLVGWVIKPKAITDEVEKNGEKMNRKKMFVVMIKYITPAMLIVLFITNVF